MDNEVIGSHYVALTVNGEPTPEQAEAMIRTALEKSGETPWRAMEIDLYPSGRGSLILARPSEWTRVYIADWALRFLMDKFGGE
jgi:hypothetical protein